MHNESILTYKGRVLLCCLLGLNILGALVILYIPSDSIIAMMSVGKGVTLSSILSLIKSEWAQGYFYWFVLINVFLLCCTVWLGSIKKCQLKSLDTPLFFFVLSIVLIVFYDGQYVLSGSFYHDDFMFLQVAKSMHFIDSIFVPHGDALMPFQRALMGLFYHVFGATPTPFIVYVIIIEIVGVFSALSFLRLYNVSFGARVAFLILVTSWTGWGMVTFAYVHAFPALIFQMFIFLYLGVIALLCWIKTGSRVKLVFGTLSLGFCLFIYHSGLWVIPVGLLVVFERGGGFGWIRLERKYKLRFIAMVSCLILIGAILFLWRMYFSDSEERIIPFYSFSSLYRLCKATIFIITHGVVNSMIFPGLTAHFNAQKIGLNFLLFIPVFFCVGCFLLTVYRATQRDKFILIFILLIFIMSTFIIPLVKPHPNLEHYIGMHFGVIFLQLPVFWFFILLSISLSAISRSTPKRWRTIYLPVCFYLLFMYAFVQNFASIGGANDSKYFLVTRGSALRIAQKTNRDLDTLKREVDLLVNAIPEDQERVIVVPDLYPSTKHFDFLSDRRFHYGIAVYSPFYSKEAQSRLLFICPESRFKKGYYAQYDSGCIASRDVLKESSPLFFEYAMRNQFWKDLLLSTPWLSHKSSLSTDTETID